MSSQLNPNTGSRCFLSVYLFFLQKLYATFPVLHLYIGLFLRHCLLHTFFDHLRFLYLNFQLANFSIQVFFFRRKGGSFCFPYFHFSLLVCVLSEAKEMEKIIKNQIIPCPSICTDLKCNKLHNKILLHLTEECRLENKAQVQNYIMNRKESILINHINTVCKIYKPGEGGQHYFMTKLTPKNRNHVGKIYAKTQEELENKILAHYLKIEEEVKITVRETLLASVGDIDKKNKIAFLCLRAPDCL